MYSTQICISFTASAYVESALDICHVHTKVRRGQRSTTLPVSLSVTGTAVRSWCGRVYRESPNVRKGPQIKVVFLSLKFPGQMQTRMGSWLPCTSSYLLQLGTPSKTTVRQGLKKKRNWPLVQGKEEGGLEKREVAQRFW